MKRFLVILLAVLCITIVSTSGISSINASSQSDVIPQWVKNNAKWWADDQISESEFIKGIQYLIDNNILRVSNQDEINKLTTDNVNLQLQNQNLQTQLQQDEEKLTMWNEYHTRVQAFFQNFNSTIQQAVQVEKCKPLTSITNGTYVWNFCDSKGNQYTWSMQTTSYDYLIKKPFPVDTILIKEADGTVVVYPDYSKFVQPSFSNVIDKVYDNAGNDEQFLYETWFIVSQMTTYSQDITNSNLWPLQTFSDAKGDCKDLSILLASMIRSSSHTKDWKIYLGILDANNPSDPKIYNHMMVSVHIGNETHFIEATQKQNGIDYWKVMLNGYWLTV